MTDTTIPNSIVWPEDVGTGTQASNTDFITAGYIATLAQSRGSDYVESGCDLQYNPAGPSVDISTGIVYCYYDGDSTVQYTSEAYDTNWDNPMVIAVSVPSVSNLSLDPDTTNEIYLAVDLEAQDDAFYRYGSNVTQPSQPSVLLGNINTSNDNTVLANREPNAAYDSVNANNVVSDVLQATQSISTPTLTGGVTGGQDLSGFTGPNLSIDPATNVLGADIDGGNADTLDNLHRNQFAANRRTFLIETAASTDDRIKIGKISDGGPDEAGKFVGTIISPTDTETNYSSLVKMNVGVDDSGHGISHYFYGISAAGSQNNSGFVVTETNGTGTNGNNEYFLYVDPADSTDILVTVEYTKFGTFDYTEGLSTADYIGSPIYETIAEPPSMDAAFGEVDTESLSGGVTGGVDLTDFTGGNLSIDNGVLNATNTQTVAVEQSGSVQLSGGSATVPTGLTEPVDVYLDPSNGGTNASDVDVVASALWDSSAGEIVVEITEDSTAVGNPVVGYSIMSVN